MPSVAHEILVEIFTQTSVLTDLFQVLGNRGLGEVEARHPNFSETKALELRADAFFTVGGSEAPSSWLILEVQTSIDRRKLTSIPLSAELAWTRYPNAAGDVVLVTAGARVARFYDRHPLRRDGPLGTRRHLDVVRVDLSRLSTEHLFDPRRPYLAVLAVAGHEAGEPAAAVARRALEVAIEAGSEVAERVVDAILTMVDASVRRELGGFMKQQGYRSEFARKYYAKGRAEAVLRVLERRGVVVSDDDRDRIAGETDQTRLDAWLDAAATADRLEDVFGQPDEA